MSLRTSPAPVGGHFGNAKREKLIEDLNVVGLWLADAEVAARVEPMGEDEHALLCVLIPILAESRDKNVDVRPRHDAVPSLIHARGLLRDCLDTLAKKSHADPEHNRVASHAAVAAHESYVTGRRVRAGETRKPAGDYGGRGGRPLWWMWLTAPSDAGIVRLGGELARILSALFDRARTDPKRGLTDGELECLRKAMPPLCAHSAPRLDRAKPRVALEWALAMTRGRMRRLREIGIWSGMLSKELEMEENRFAIMAAALAFGVR